MTEYVASQAPDHLPLIDYLTVDDDQAGYVSEAMTLTENKTKFEVTFIPIDTPEARHKAATELSAYRIAMGRIAARDMGAVMIGSTRDDSVEAYEAMFERQLAEPAFEVHALMKVIKKTSDAKLYDLLRKYYEPDTASEE